MDPRLLDLYEHELRYFRESSGEFARAYPKIARRLGLDGPEVADPYVERLIEASASVCRAVSRGIRPTTSRNCWSLAAVLWSWSKS